MRDGLDGVQVDTDDEGAFRHVLFGYLEPTTGSGTQVDTAFGLAEEVIFAVQVDQLASLSVCYTGAAHSYNRDLQCRTRSVTLLLG